MAKKPVKKKTKKPRAKSEGKKVKKLGPFDFLNAINFSKEDIMIDPESEKAYLPFIINRGLSYFSDTVILANEMNIAYHISSRMQFDFLRAIVRKRKRFSKWYKAEENDTIDLIKQYYGYNTSRATEALQLLSEADIATMKQTLNHGGIK